MIAVVIPTIGRDTLARTVESASWADRIIVFWDGPEPDIYRPTWPRSLPVTKIVTSQPFKNWGHGQRNLALELAPAYGITHFSFMDDDDVYTADAGDAIRAAVSAEPENVHMFCMTDGGTVYGTERVVEPGMVGTPMIVCPASVKARWADRYEGDFDFISGACDEFPVTWHADVIARVRPE